MHIRVNCHSATKVKSALTDRNLIKESPNMSNILITNLYSCRYYQHIAI